jgi:serine/threonine-protein kinase
MARVFVAHDTKLDRAVVINVLDPDLAGGLAISADRFAREIKLAAGLQQANIVPVLNAGEAGGEQFLREALPWLDKYLE